MDNPDTEHDNLDKHHEFMDIVALSSAEKCS